MSRAAIACVVAVATLIGGGVLEVAAQKPVPGAVPRAKHAMTCEEDFTVPGYGPFPQRPACPPIAPSSQKTATHIALRDAATRATQFLACPAACPTLTVKKFATSSVVCDDPDKMPKSGDEVVLVGVDVVYRCK